MASHFSKTPPPGTADKMAFMYFTCKNTGWDPIKVTKLKYWLLRQLYREQTLFTAKPKQLLDSWKSQVVQQRGFEQGGCRRKLNTLYLHGMLITVLQPPNNNSVLVFPNNLCWLRYHRHSKYFKIVLLVKQFWSCRCCVADIHLHRRHYCPVSPGHIKISHWKLNSLQ